MRKFWRPAFLIFIVAFTATGCASDFVGVLKDADNAIAEARSRGADKKCPEEFNEVRMTRARAYDIFWLCHTEEAIKLAGQAAEKARGLCPVEKMAAKIVKKPKPAHRAVAPPPTPTPPAVAEMDTDSLLNANDAAPEPETFNAYREEVAPAPPAKLDLKEARFAYDSSDLNDTAMRILDEDARTLKQNPNIRIRLEGHTDSRGSLSYNQTLSLRRANAVKDYLVNRCRIDPGRLESVGLGEKMPVADNASDAGRAMNRHVSFVIIKGK